VELFIPPRKGRRHVLRLIRELLAFAPQGTGTDIKLALDTINRVLKQRSIVFLISDFLADVESYRRVLAVTNRRHDLVAVDLDDPLERQIGDVGLLALEDAESGELVWVDTSSTAWRKAFGQQVAARTVTKRRAFNRAQVDRIGVTTEADYVGALTKFFQRRAQRR
jgi:uncharacterized protein (DUF58 family)